MSDKSISLFTKESPFCDIAVDFVTKNFKVWKVIKYRVKDLVAETIVDRETDYIISFLYPDLLPEHILGKAKIAAINFHPGPPEYPGTGCYNFALYNDDSMFGSTCHHMLKKADSGKIISVKRYPIFPSDTVQSLKARTMIYTLENFFEIMYILIRGKDLPVSRDEWKGEPRTRKDLENLLNITADMPTSEIDRRIRATYSSEYPGPFIEIRGKKYSIRYA